MLSLPRKEPAKLCPLWGHVSSLFLSASPPAPGSRGMQNRRHKMTITGVRVGTRHGFEDGGCREKLGAPLRQTWIYSQEMNSGEGCLYCLLFQNKDGTEAQGLERL